jgi:transposase
VAIAEGGRAGEVRFLGEVEKTPATIERMIKKLAGRYARLHVCFEAGPTGYGLYRQVQGLGHDCMVVAPALIPKRSGERVKTNRRDAVTLARLHRAGELTGVWAPDPAHVRRFDAPRQLMAFLGLVPAERSTGDTVRRTGLTLAGNRRARRALIEAAWTYRYPARVSETLRTRREGLPKVVRGHCHGNLFLLTITHPPTEATTCDSNRLALRSRRLERPLLASRDNAINASLLKRKS